MKFKEKHIISHDQSIKLSSVYLSYIILKILKGKERISILELYSALKKKDISFQYKPTMYALVFLHMSGIVDFNSPYIYNLKD